ncbi:hypothetical protein MKX03_000022 [Papaver bracteatum]|nr:hypothetical protein MKX03_000022 [Papaver bracteatum]
MWKAYRVDSSDSTDLLFSVKKSKFYHIKKNLDVFLASNITENICDFKIKEIYHDKSCIICRGDSENIIAEMHMNKAIEGKVRGKHTFSVTVYPNIDYAFVIAIRVVFYEINNPNSRKGDGCGGTGGGDGGGGNGGGCGGGGGGGE